MIKRYLSYLKDISRKIVADSGFEKALLDKSKTNKAFTFQVNNFILRFNENDDQYFKIKNIDDYLSKNNDKRLFCGFGLIGGTKGRQYAAPIIYTECVIFKEHSSYVIEVDFETNSFNYDLVTSILNYNIESRYVVENDDTFNEDIQKEVDIVENIENKILNINNLDHLNSYSNEVFHLLKSKLIAFSNIKIYKNDYSYNQEINIFNDKPKKTRNNNILSIDTRERQSIFEGDLVYVNGIHFFVNAIPHQLSSYEALSKLTHEIEKKKFQNRILEKMLTNVLTDKRVHLNTREVDDIEDILKKYIPLSFSDSQISAIKNAFSSEISYIQGPPGTGKSYTIGAIVLCALFLNKKVLLVSQKEAALDVIKEKIEGFLTDVDDSAFKGITYYKNTNKAELRTNISNLTKNGNSQRSLNLRLNKLDELIKTDEEWISLQVLKIDELENKLSENLQAEYKFKEKHNEFISNRDWFLNQHGIPNELKLSDTYIFLKNGISLKAYKKSLDTIDKISKTHPNLTTELYKYKFKKHIKETFKINFDTISDNLLYQYSKNIIELHDIHTKSYFFRNKINQDNEQLRGNLDNLKKELVRRQLVFLKHKFKYYTLSKISNNLNKNAALYLDNLYKLDRLLHWKKPSKIANQMSEIDYNLIVDIMPFWLAEARYLGQVLPMDAEIFDLVIVDESSQVNLAEILPAFYRGKQIVIVGDHEQLGLDSTGVNFRLSNRFDNLIWQKNFLNLPISFAAATDKSLTVTQSSILDFIRSPNNNVTIRTEMLKEHFRSMPALAKFTNTSFYQGVLRIMTETSDKISKDCFKIIQVEGVRETQSKTILPEAEKVIDLIKHLTNTDNIRDNIDLNLPTFDNENISIGVISLMTNQKELIADLIDENINQDVILKHKIEVWTPQSAQGNERDIIILSFCLDLNCNGMGNYHKNPKLLNVATSRAKKYTIIVHSGFKKDKYPQLSKYLNITANRLEWTLNHSAYESEFEKKVYEKLNDYVSNKKDFNLRIYNQVETCGQKRLDFVVFNETNKRAVAIEVDGSYHYQNNGLDRLYSVEHTERIEILKRAGWNVINTPYYKWYKNGWLSDIEHPIFLKELERINYELDYYLL